MQKDDQEHPVPESLRPMFREIAGAFAAGDFQLRHHLIDGVDPIDATTAEHIAANIAAYGDVLVPLDDATWDHSICRWMDGHWLFLIDLTTEPASDLTLHARLHESSANLEVGSAHVP